MKKTYRNPTTMQFLSPLTTVLLKSIFKPAWSALTRSTIIGSKGVRPSSGIPAARAGIARWAEDFMQAVSELTHGVRNGARMAKDASSMVFFDRL